MLRSIALFALALPLGLLAAGPTPWPAAPAAIEQLAREAATSNLALAGEGLEVERASAQLAAARSALLPRLDLSARYSLASGGRTIDLPVGDLMNPAYATLNQLLAAQGQPPRFATIPNQSFSLLREREQQTALRLTQPLFRPEISHGARAARAGLAARQAQLAAFRRQLRAEVHEAFFRHEQARSAIAIYDSALALVGESLRVNRSLVSNGKLTEDNALRAQAEFAAVTQQVQEARRDEDAAAAYLNFLLNRPLGTPIEPLDESTGEAFANTLIAADASSGSITGREELIALEQARLAASQSAAAVQSRRLPTLGLALEGGIQGENYRSGPGRNYTMGSVVLDWNLFDGSQRKSDTAQARIDQRQAERRLSETRLQLELQLRQARNTFITAQSGLEAARLRRQAARATYELVARREAEGLAIQLTVLDARNTLTSAELNYAITRAQLCIAAARFDQAAALSPLF